MRTAARKGVIETFIVDWPVLLFVGLVFGNFGPGASWGRSRAFMAGLVVSAVFTATAVVSYLVAPDWMWMYFLDPSEVAVALPLVVIGYLFVYAVGFAASVGLARAGRRGPWVFAAWAFVSEVVAVVVTWDRYHLVGTRQEWLRGSAHELVSLTPTGPARIVALLGLPVVLSFAISVLNARRRGRETVVGR